MWEERKHFPEKAKLKIKTDGLIQISLVTEANLWGWHWGEEGVTPGRENSNAKSGGSVERTVCVVRERERRSTL